MQIKPLQWERDTDAKHRRYQALAPYGRYFLEEVAGRGLYGCYSYDSRTVFVTTLVNKACDVSDEDCWEKAKRVCEIHYLTEINKFIG